MYHRKDEGKIHSHVLWNAIRRQLFFLFVGEMRNGKQTKRKVIWIQKENEFRANKALISTRVL